MHELRALKRARRAVTAFFFFLGFGGGNWLAHVPKIRHQLGLNDSQLGFLLLAGGVGALVAFRTARLVLRHLQNQQVIFAASVVSALTLFVPAAAPSAWLAALGLFVIGYCNGLVDVTINAAAVDVEKRLKKPILSSMHGFCSLGGFAGAASGMLATGLQLTPTLHLLGVGVVMAGASALLRGDLLAEDHAATGAATATIPFTLPLLLLGGVAFCSSIGEGAMAQWTAVYLHDELHTSFFVATVGYACYSAAMVAGRLLGDKLCGLWPADAVFRRCSALTAGCLAVGLSSRSPLLMVAGSMGVGLGLSLIIPTVFRCAVRLPGMSSAAALTKVATLSYGGFLLGPPCIGLIAQAFSLRVALGVVAVLAAVMGVVGTRVSATLERPALAPSPQGAAQPTRSSP